MKNKFRVFTQNLANQEFQKVLFELSDELASNYIGNSFGDTDKEIIDCNRILVENSNYDFFIPSPDNIELKTEKNIIFGNETVQELGTLYNEKIKSTERRRNILVIGAGASHDMYPAIPLGSGVMEAFKKRFVESLKAIDFLKKKYDFEVNNVKKLTNREDINFENLLYVLNTFFVNQEDLRAEMGALTDFRYLPSLFYEIVAHMLKHSFIDVVINFNFDELLDQAIEEELGKNNYRFILSDGDCSHLSELAVDGRLKFPIYIKPHGTFSHKSSLRFTNKHYLDLPKDIRDMLVELIKGERGNKKDETNRTLKPIQKVNLICVGFNLGSLEFNDIINEHLPKNSKIFHFCYDNPQNKEGKEQSEEERIANQLNKFFPNRATKAGITKFKEIYKPIWVNGFNQGIDTDLKEFEEKIKLLLKDDEFTRNPEKEKIEEIFNKYNMTVGFNTYLYQGSVTHAISSLSKTFS